MFNKLKLKGKIAESGLTQAEIAEKIGISAQSLNAKVNGARPFNADEIQKLIPAISLTNEDLVSIFFATDVDR